MGFFDLFRRKGGVAGFFSIRNMPAHELLTVRVVFTRVPEKDSPLPAYDPDDPFLKGDYLVTILEAGEPEAQPFEFKTRLPEGYYCVAMAAWLTREIKGRPSVQIENFDMYDHPIPVTRGKTIILDRYVEWPSIPDDDLHIYGTLDGLAEKDEPEV